MKQHTLSALFSSLVVIGVFALALPAGAEMGSGMMDDMTHGDAPKKK